jgi:RNA polymerase sigma-70 factor, ECF subfamily
MKPAGALALPKANWSAEYLEDTSLRRKILEQYDREHISLLRYVAFLGIDPESCRDVVQDSFLKLHEHLLAGGDRSNLRAWLYRVAHNTARNKQTAAHSKTSSMDELAGIAEPKVTGASPEDSVLEAERWMALRRAMEGLSPVRKQCLVLRAQGFKYREIADVLQLSVSTVGEHIQRGLEQLRKEV